MTTPAIIEQPRLRLAALRHTGAYYLIGQTFAKLQPLVEAATLAGDHHLIAVYHDDPETTPEPRLRSDAGIVLNEGDAVPAGLNEVILAPGRYAKVRHLGPYDTLPTTWAAVKNTFLVRPGQRRGHGPSYEIYLNTPMNAAPGDLITDIYIPLA